MGKVIEFYKSNNVDNLLLFTGQFPENNVLECDFRVFVETEKHIKKIICESVTVLQFLANTGPYVGFWDKPQIISEGRVMEAKEAGKFLISCHFACYMCEFLSATTTNNEELIIKTIINFMHQYKYTGKIL